MVSVPSGLQACPYCEILGHGKVEINTEDLLERHGVQKTPRVANSFKTRHREV